MGWGYRTTGGLLIDPFCGSGTVLGEARRAGWRAAGFDADPSAVHAAAANHPDVAVAIGDAAALPVATGAAAAIVTNAPFGVRHAPRTGGLPPAKWWRVVLQEVIRVVRPGGAVVILHPADSIFVRVVRSSAQLALEKRIAIRTLGRPATIWSLRREAFDNQSRTRVERSDSEVPSPQARLHDARARERDVASLRAAAIPNNERPKRPDRGVLRTGE